MGVPNDIVSHRSRPTCRADPHPRREDSGLPDWVEGLLARGGDVLMEGNDLVASPLEAEQKPGLAVELRSGRLAPIHPLRWIAGKRMRPDFVCAGLFAGFAPVWCIDLIERPGRHWSDARPHRMS